ncbi:hypothetical protein HW132_18720 [Brasilonema sp. CT11]|nr:hypothetical protein [Brasilonema sp. CT11]
MTYHKYFTGHDITQAIAHLISIKSSKAMLAKGALPLAIAYHRSGTW